MKLSITVNIQKNIGRPSVFLTGIGYASGVHRNDVIVHIDYRTMGMSEECHITPMLSGSFFNTQCIEADTVPMSMGHKYSVMSHGHDFFCRHGRKKIIIATDHVGFAGRNTLYVAFTALQIAQMKHQI